MGLQEEIESGSAEISTDRYSMSIGELISLYEQEEIDIHPEFQRFYRWTLAQKSRLIESMLLGIPLPPIFVSQRVDGVWDVVDGLQRISTILEFSGILKNEVGALLPTLTLEKTRYLPSLNRKRWQSAKEDGGDCLTPAQRLYLKRVRLDVIIIKKESDPRSKYELFQRLNTGGTPLSDQEVRNCLLIMVNRDRFLWFASLADDPSFKACTALSERSLDEQYDRELVLRFLVLRKLDQNLISQVEELGEFLTDKMLEIAESATFSEEAEELAFKRTFSLILKALGDDAFRRYDPTKDRFLGGFLVSAFEAVALGLGHNIGDWSDASNSDDLAVRVKEIWRREPFQPGQGSGRRASTRLAQTIPLGRERFIP